MIRGLFMANALALVAAIAWLTILLVPVSRAVRARNATLLRRGTPADFDWTPAAPPSDFRLEHRRAPAAIEDAVRSAGILDVVDDWPRALALVALLLRHWRKDGPIQADLATTYRGIVAGSGYCADFVRVFMAAAHSAGLTCRQWAFSFDGFGGHGHTFVEVFDRQRQTWVYLDVHNNVYAVLQPSDIPSDALALRRALVDAPKTAQFRRASTGRLGFPDPAKLLDYYRRGAQEWYLWWGNDVITREQRAAVTSIGLVSRRLAHRIGALFGTLPAIVVLVTPSNERAIARMERLRGQLHGALATSGVLAFSLITQAAWRLLANHHG